MGTEKRRTSAGLGRRRKQPQLSLLTAADVAGRNVEDGGESLYFITNRMNMLAVLSSGLIRPREGLEKYYDDLCTLTPGRIPLWTGKIPGNVLAESSTDSFFPVLFEVGPSCLLADSVPGIGRDLKKLDTMLPDFDDQCLCLLPSAVIPLSLVRRIHLRSEDEKADMLARGFDNLDLEALPIEISPDLFAGEPVPWEEFKSALSLLEEPGELAQPALYRRMDSYAGALAMMTVTMPVLPAWLEQLADMLGASMHDDASLARGVSWMRTLGELLTSGKTGAEVESFESGLFLAAARLAASTSPRDGFEPEEFVSQVGQDIEFRGKENQQDRIDKFVERTRQILANEVDGVSFDDDPDKERIVQRSVAFFLMRVKPDRILQARDKPNPPGDAVLATAAILAGIHCGAERLPMSVRSRIGWWRLLLLVLADRCNQEGRSEVSFIESVAPQVKLTVRENGPARRRTTVELNGEELKALDQYPGNSMMKVFHLAHEADISLHYRFEESCFVHYAESRDEGLFRDDQKESADTVKIFEWTGIEPRGTTRKLGIVRFLAVCDNLSEELSVDMSSRILEMNSRTSLARFAIDREGRTLLAISDQVVDTIDREELLAHIHAVRNASRAWNDQRE